MTAKVYVGKPGHGMSFLNACTKADELMIELSAPDFATESANFERSQYKRCSCCGANVRYLFPDSHCVECTKVCPI